MKRIGLFWIKSLLWLCPIGLSAQVDIYNVDAANNGTTVNYDIVGSAVGICDNGGPDARYTPGDYYLTVTSNCVAPNRFCFIISELDIACTDTLFIYDGPDTNGAVRAKINNCTGHAIDDLVYVSAANTSGMLTVRLKSANTTVGGTGFTLTARCFVPCENIYAEIDSMFYRTRNGVIYDSAYQRQVPVYDTTYNVNSNGDTLGISAIDTSYFTGVHLCVGDGVIFRGHGVYTYDHGYYTPSDATTHFTWDMANEGDTLQGIGMTEIHYDQYQRTGCYDLTLTIVDEFGCTSNILTSVRIRTSLNPLKTIFTIGDICNNAERLVSMGYDGDNATLTLRTIENQMTVSKVNEVRTFIPDGCADASGSTCYSAPVLFTEFPPSKRVTSGADVCSICINMEHTFMGDISVRLVCPTGNKAPLFFGNYDPARAALPSTEKVAGGPGMHGSGTDMGCPHSSNNGCDTVQNPYGVGFDYCFSRNVDYTLVTGDPAGSIIGRPSPGNYYITTSSAYTIAVNPPVTYTIPAGFGSYSGQTVSYSSTTKKPSNHEEKTDYYLPYTDFSELIGCPLNGTWAIEICDDWPGDNGWVFNWSLDICGVSQDQDCRYEVAIDSLVWRPRPGHEDYDLGRYRGLQVRRETPIVSYLSSPDTAGHFPIDVFIYDEFGCIWDTTTSITTYLAPEPDLGPDTTLCGVSTMTLDARDRHSELPSENYTYLWNPFGQETSTIETSSDGEDVGDITYIVEVKNTRRSTVCTTRDTIFIRQRKQPYPSFLSEPLSFEGCAPFTLSFENRSSNTDRHFWDFGDGITSEHESPVHTYAEGIYTLKYYALSDDGCVDSVISPNGIVVYPTPKANFIWEPVYPSVSHPIVQFTNTTQPHSGNSQYRWEFQYDRNNNLSVHTLTDRNPTFNYATYASDDGLSGNYAVRLIAFTDNLAPSGNRIQCRDTAENMILIINDFLQFPNVVTPNGDGINDRFVIINLLDGIGYPINQLDIYNRWGTRVYHKENISSDEDFWDPADLPAGTYFYRFSAKGYSGNIEHNGAIEVVK